MIVPSIDLRGGNTVQLIGGKELALDAGDPRPIAESFGRVGEIAVIDLDAAMSRGSNVDMIRELLPIARCRVGGGIRDVQAAVRWLDAGAAKVILGTAARPNILRELPPERVIAALDAVDGEVVVEGWNTRTGQRVEDRIDELKGLVGGFLITFVEQEGRMTGLPSERVRELVERAAPARVTVAGGVRDARDIAAADEAGADAQVGMALYTGAMGIADAFAAPLRSDRADGLWPTIIVDERGVALGLAYSSPDSLRASLETGRGVYFSRSRGSLWEKGSTSGDTQELIRVDADCDRDTLRFTVRQHGRGFCHAGTRTCFGDERGLGLLERTVEARVSDAPPSSYTRRLLEDHALIASKLREEADELVNANDRAHAAEELADVLYFAAVAAARRGATITDAERVLDARALRITRRAGDAKEEVRGNR
ncbi:MAG: phosphoribosyl-ATP diphosphatase [Phycisphaerales bacterium]|jgi:phosphoribosyl-ATP pyrophosphohydrolase|nr:phosphoribosyl-ATP diphosphatase [Phycisphaerales bacterium]